MPQSFSLRHHRCLEFWCHFRAVVFSVVSGPSLATRKIHLVIGDIPANVAHSLPEETELQRGKGPIQRADKNHGEEAVLSLG